MMEQRMLRPAAPSTSCACPLAGRPHPAEPGRGAVAAAAPGAGHGGVPARVPGDMVLVAPPDAGRGRCRVPCRRAGLATVRALGPAAGARGGVVRRPGGGSPRNPRCSLHSQGNTAFF